MARRTASGSVKSGSDTPGPYRFAELKQSGLAVCEGPGSRLARAPARSLPGLVSSNQRAAAARRHLGRNSNRSVAQPHEGRATAEGISEEVQVRAAFGKFGTCAALRA